MTAFAVGMLVQHASLGVGKIVAVEANAVHVFFPRSDKRHAAKFQLAGAGTFLSTEGVAPDEWLEGLTTFSLDAALGRYALAEGWLTHDQAIARFVARWPAGFSGPSTGPTSPAARCAAWRAAGAAWAQALGSGQGDRLLAAGEIIELTERVASVGAELAPVAPGLGPAELAAALSDEATAAPFLEALLSVLAVPSPARARFERLFAAAGALDVDPGIRWRLATVFPLVANPARAVLLSPQAAAAAERLGCNLRLTPGPTWTPYAALRVLSSKLLRSLAALGARDFVDVEVFLHAVASDRGGGEPRRAARPARSSRARS